MTAEFGPISYGGQDKQQEAFQKPFSEATGQKLDAEIRKIITVAHERTTALMNEHKDKVIKLAERLLEKETIQRADMVELLGPRPFDEPDAFDEGLGWKSQRAPGKSQPLGGGTGKGADAELPQGIDGGAIPLPAATRAPVTEEKI